MSNNPCAVLDYLYKLIFIFIVRNWLKCNTVIEPKLKKNQLNTHNVSYNNQKKN